MNSVTRTFGKLTHRSPGDNARVSNLLNDYEDVDRLLAKLIAEARSLRDSWHYMVISQLNAAGEYVTLYDPITGATDGHGRRAEPTPEEQLNRSFNLRRAFEDVKEDMLLDIAGFEASVIKPGSDARDYIQPLRRTIKKRENKRMDYEKCQEKVKKLQRKPGKSAKEDAQVHKAEDELARATEEFQIADNHIKESLPPIIHAVFSLIPPLLGAIIETQNRLLGLSYTTIHQYCVDNHFPSPPPPMESVTADWETAFGPIQKEIEAFYIIRSGRSSRQAAAGSGSANGNRKPGLSPAPPISRNGVRRVTSDLLPSKDGPGNESRRPAPAEEAPAPRPAPPKLSASYGSGVATDFTMATKMSTPSAISTPASRGPVDYFGHTTKRQTSELASIAGKKKPPPPPPKKLNKPDETVIALYDFEGEGHGDLSFQEGDLIKIVKKTETDQDWWVGELRGTRGNFPANYCRPA